MNSRLRTVGVFLLLVAAGCGLERSMTPSSAKGGDEPVGRVWSTSLEGAYVQGTALEDLVAFAVHGVAGNAVVGLSAADGTTRWTVAVPSNAEFGFNMAATRRGPLVHYTEETGREHLVLLDAASGAVLWDVETPMYDVSGEIADDIGLIAIGEGHDAFIDLDTGALAPVPFDGLPGGSWLVHDERIVEVTPERLRLGINPFQSGVAVEEVNLPVYTRDVAIVGDVVVAIVGPEPDGLTVPTMPNESSTPPADQGSSLVGIVDGQERWRLDAAASTMLTPLSDRYLLLDGGDRFGTEVDSFASQPIVGVDASGAEVVYELDGRFDVTYSTTSGDTTWVVATRLTYNSSGPAQVMLLRLTSAGVQVVGPIDHEGDPVIWHNQVLVFFSGSDQRPSSIDVLALDDLREVSAIPGPVDIDNGGMFLTKDVIIVFDASEDRMTLTGYQ